VINMSEMFYEADNFNLENAPWFGITSKL